MNAIGNILWLVLGGIISVMTYFLGGLMMMATIIGIPFGLQMLKISLYCLMPFGKEIVISEKATGCIPMTLNILWIIILGFWDSVSHLIIGALLFITIIGIPFAKIHFRLATLAFIPFGIKIQDK